MIKKLGLGYDKIDACLNHCMLYWGSSENESRDKCKVCNTSRYMSNENDIGANVVIDDQHRKKPKPAKVLRYCPLIPRLKRLYMCSKTAELLKWHATEANPDGLLRHPRDGKAWKHFDSFYPDFALKTRNVRFALATDGFNPFGNLSSSVSIWPVMLYIYNYPPWCFMKQSSLIMSMIIPGPKMPENSIDVYLQPLIAELKQLWDGVNAYDSSTKEMFQLRAALMWTISDFPGLDNLSGWNTHTSLACPSCNYEIDSMWLKFGRKNCFMGHRRFLPHDHKYRYNKKSFNGFEEHRPAPTPPSGLTLLSQIEKSRKRPRDDGTSKVGPKQWKKKSIFWDLPYWKNHLIRHCLDLMHVEKNVCDNVLYTILGDKKKSKDNLQARKDLQVMGIREKLHPYPNSSKFPPSCFNMKKDKKDIFLKVLNNVVFPDNYASNFSRCVDVKKRKISNLKSHDSHILMEHLLPIACRKALPREVTSVLIELCNYFREISRKVLDVKHVENLEQRIWLNHANVEAIFPPSFFTIMFHLVIHIGEEAILAGPVQGHWMYPVERGMGHFKSYVHNNSAAEGCIAEGCLTEENLTNCSQYFEDANIETRFNRPRRNDDGNEINVSSESTILSNLFPASGKPIGAIKTLSISSVEIIQAHRYVLANCEIFDAFREKFKIEVTRMYRGKRNSSKLVEEYVHKHFHEWFKEYVASQNGVEITSEIELLANGPNNVVRRFKEYNIHGFKFRTIWKEQGLKTQNSGIVMSAVTKRFSSGRGSIEQSSDDMYYGKLVDIIELNYYGKLKVVLFKCLWVDTTLNKGIKIDQFGITSVNFTRLIHTGVKETDEPFILASDARMVYYVDDPIDEDWCCVCHMKPRDIYDMGDVDFVDLEEPPMEDIPFCEQHLENIEDLPLVRVDQDEQEQDKFHMKQKRKKSVQELLASLRGHQAENISVTFQDLQQQVNGDQQEDQLENENIITPTLSDNNLNSSSSSNEANTQEKEEPLVVKIKDTSTGEVTTQKMQPDRVWNLEKNQKIMVELNGDGQGSDNGSNLLVRFLGKLSQKSVFCPISVQRWDRTPEEKTRLQWQLIEENFEFDYVVGIKWVMHSLRDRWRAYKYKLRCDHFYPKKRKEEILANHPANVDSNDWTAFVHHYKEDKMKIQSAQNTRNRTKLKVSHAGGSKSNARRGRQMEQNLGRPVCRREVVLSTLLKKNGNYVNEEGKILADKILEHLPEDQEHAATLGVPLKILAHPNDAIGKVYGVEHSGRVRGIGGNVCPSAAFGMPRHSISHVNVGTSNNMSHQRVENLEKHVETLEEKLTGYEETKEKLEETKKRLAQNENHLATLHRFLQAKFGSELPTFNIDSS
ncbi:hypothetical protein KY285_018630 [Solanum tuberosum]|nr:hypothetical protein KY285_018630 [Solanum tuberosum]